MTQSEFKGRELLGKPACPFCGLLIERPLEPYTRRPGNMPVGRCDCGAVYACDETGHNLGSALIEALLFACDMDWDLAWDLVPDEDYEQERIEHYDYVHHLIVPGGFFESRRISGVLLFIRLQEEVREVTDDGVRIGVAKASSGSYEPKAGKASDPSLSKSEIEECVREFRVDAILGVAGNDRKLVRNLQRLLYSGDDEFRQRAADLLGRAAAVIAEEDPRIIARLLQSLFTSISDTAASSWGAFEAIGEIVSRRTDLFAGYIPQLYQFLPDGTRKAQALKALGKIALSRPQLLRSVTFHVISLLNDTDPKVRGYAAWILGNLRAHEVREDLKKLLDQPYEVEIYENGNLGKKSLGQVAQEALEKL